MVPQVRGTGKAWEKTEERDVKWDRESQWVCVVRGVVMRRKECGRCGSVLPAIEGEVAIPIMEVTWMRV